MGKHDAPKHEGGMGLRDYDRLQKTAIIQRTGRMWKEYRRNRLARGVGRARAKRYRKDLTLQKVQ